MNIVEIKFWTILRRYLLPAGVICTAILVLAATGYLGIGRVNSEDVGRPSDFRFFYAAGATWLKGKSPYELNTYQEVSQVVMDQWLPDVPFAYPPNFVPFTMVSALLPLNTSYIVIHFLNGIAVLLLSWIALKLVKNPIYSRPASHSNVSWWIIAAVIIASPFTSRAIWLGQITLWSCFFLMAAWYYIRNCKRDVLGGALLAFAGIKPQLFILPFLWLMLERRWKAVAVSVLVTLLLSSYAFFLLGPVEMITQWLSALKGYQTVGPNMLGWENIVGLPSFLAAIDLKTPNPFISVLIAGTIVIFIFFWFRARLLDDDILGLLMSFHFVVVYGHNTDLVYLLPMWVALWLHAENHPKSWPFLFTLLVILWLPARAIGLFGVHFLLQWKTLIILAAMIYLLYLSSNCKSRLSLETL